MESTIAFNIGLLKQTVGNLAVNFFLEQDPAALPPVPEGGVEVASVPVTLDGTGQKPGIFRVTFQPTRIFRAQATKTSLEIDILEGEGEPASDGTVESLAAQLQTLVGANQEVADQTILLKSQLAALETKISEAGTPDSQEILSDFEIFKEKMEETVRTTLEEAKKGLQTNYQQRFQELKAKVEAEKAELTTQLTEEKQTALLALQEQFEGKLDEFCRSQNTFMQKTLKESVEKLKQIKKIFSLCNVQPAMLEKIKSTLAGATDEPSPDVEVVMINARDHFRNIHEIYLDLLMKQPTQASSPSPDKQGSCAGITKIEPGTKAPDCLFYQRLSYSKDLLLKFVALDQSHKFHREVLSAFVDVFELDKRQTASFFANLKHLA